MPGSAPAQGSGLLDPAYLFRQTADPSALAGFGALYSKEVTGVTQLFFRSSDGTIHQLTPPAGAGAPVDAQYLVLVANATLTQERVFTPGTGIAATDGGAGGAYTVTNTLRTGLAGGQTAIGGTAAGEHLNLESTSNVTKGRVRIASGSDFDILNGQFYMGGTLVLESDLDIAIGLVPASDTGLSIGTTARRWNSLFAINVGVYPVGGANPTVQMLGTQLNFGAGGASTIDVSLTRGAVDRLDLVTGDSFNIVNGNLQFGATTLFESDRDLAVDLIPNATLTLNLGSASRVFSGLWVNTPTITSFVNSPHNHQNAAGGGTLDAAAIASGVFPVARGGTNKSSWTAGSVVFAGASGTALAEDNSNFFWDDTNNRLLVGTATTTDKFGQIHVQGTADPVGYFADAYGTGINPQVIGRRARGTVGTPAAVQSGDILFQMGGRGHDGTAFAGGTSGRISVIANQTFTSTARGTYMEFLTTPNGSTTLTRRMYIDATGEVNVGPIGPFASGSIDFSVRKNTSAVDTTAIIEGAADAQAWLGFSDPSAGGVPWLFLYWGTTYGSNAFMLYNGILGNVPWYCNHGDGYNAFGNYAFDFGPSSHVDIRGSFALRNGDTSVLAATQNNFDIIADAGTEQSVYRISTSAAISITGIVAPPNGAWRILILINVGANNVTLVNQSASSTAANRFLTATGANIVLGANNSAMLWYDITTARWRVINREL